MKSIAFDTNTKRDLQKIDKNSIALARKSVPFHTKSNRTSIGNQLEIIAKSIAFDKKSVAFDTKSNGNNK